MSGPSTRIFGRPIGDATAVMLRTNPVKNAGQRSNVGRVADYRLVLLFALSAGFFLFAHIETEPYDDAHFFKRVAAHALSHGKLAWNVGEGPTYGSTSLLFQLLALPVVALSFDYYMLLTRLLALASLVGAFAVLLTLTRRMDGGLAATIALAAPPALYPLVSGMETSFTFLMLSLVLWLSWSERALRWPWGVACLAVAMVYALRPDAVLLAMAALLLARFEQSRRLPWRELALIGGLLALIILCCRLYFGTALPLPFYAKQAAFSPYDAHFRELSRVSGIERFCAYFLFAAPLFLLASAKRDRVNLGLLGAVVLHALYHLTLTVDVMGMHGRFYVPELPLLAFAGARGAGELRKRRSGRAALIRAGAFGACIYLFWALGLLPAQTSFKLDQVSWFALVLSCFALLHALTASASSMRKGRSAALLLLLATFIGEVPVAYAGKPRVISDDEYLSLHTSRYTTYRGLDTLRACFGADLDLYHSEIGVPGLRFLGGEVADLAGLMSPTWLFRKPNSFDSLCMRDNPEAIFLPHTNYGSLNEEIMRGKCIKNYRRVVENSASPLFVRKDLRDAFLECARVRKDPWVSIPGRPREDGG